MPIIDYYKLNCTVHNTDNKMFLLVTIFFNLSERIIFKIAEMINWWLIQNDNILPRNKWLIHVNLKLNLNVEH